MRRKKMYIISIFILLIIFTIFLYFNFTKESKEVFDGTLVNNMFFNRI